MILLLILALAAAAVAAVLVARAFGLARGRTVQNMTQIHAYGFAAAPLARESRSTVQSGINSLAGRIGAAVLARAGAAHEEKVRSMLVSAGLYTLPARRFIGYRILAAAGLPILAYWVTIRGGHPGVMSLGVVAVAAVLGWRLPMGILQKRSTHRLGEIEHALPELIDLLTVTIEAGLGLNGSMQVASRRLRGPLGDELRLTMQEQTLGLSSEQTLRNLLGRADTPAMRSFIRSVLQGEALGVSIGQIMRDLSNDMRLRRRQAAEERAQKAPVKMLFPLIFLIFPAMFIVLLGPAVFSFLETFGGP